jgi:hypothetical protein
MVIRATDEGEPSITGSDAEDLEDEAIFLACGMPCVLCS